MDQEPNSALKGKENSVVDPDPDSMGSLDTHLDPREQKWPRKIKQLINFIFRSAGCSFWRAKGFSCSLDVLNEGLGIGKLQILIKKSQRKEKNFSCIFYCSSKPWIRFRIWNRIRIRIYLQCWIRIRTLKVSYQGDFLNFFLYVLYSTLLHLPPLRFHCVGGCWDRTIVTFILISDSAI